MRPPTRGPTLFLPLVVGLLTACSDPAPKPVEQAPEHGEALGPDGAVGLAPGGSKPTRKGKGRFELISASWALDPDDKPVMAPPPPTPSAAEHGQLQEEFAKRAAEQWKGTEIFVQRGALTEKPR